MTALEAQGQAHDDDTEAAHRHRLQKLMTTDTLDGFMPSMRQVGAEPPFAVVVDECSPAYSTRKPSTQAMTTLKHPHRPVMSKHATTPSRGRE